ncbi:MAG TPA: phosphoglycerate mutase family protein [Thermoanaerobaculia bacterium]|jgi:broad specificity phosphatase PhoE
MKRRRAIAVLIALLLPAAARAQKALIIVRHADKISDSDERLSEAGVARSAKLAAMLKDAGVTAIYTTNTERAIDTAKPLADALRLSVQAYDTRVGAGAKLDSRPFVERLRKENGGEVVLVVGHSNTVPDLLKTLGCPGEITIAPGEYDNLFVVVPKGDGMATTVRLRY